MEGNHFFPEAVRNLLSAGYAILCKTERSICLKREKNRVLFDRISGELLCRWENEFSRCLKMGVIKAPLLIGGGICENVSGDTMFLLILKYLQGIKIRIFKIDSKTNL